MRPLLYSFRRCPYAMRARLALHSAGIEVELREILLRDKPGHMLEVSPKGTVPVLIVDDEVIDESRDIMMWALAQNDPENWLNMPQEGHAWIDTIDGPFKKALDRYKYPTRYEGVDRETERDKAAEYLRQIEPKLTQHTYIYGDTPTLADMASVTFVRQYAHVDKAWFDEQDWPGLKAWLSRFLASDLFAQIMRKYPQWKDGDDVTLFGRGN